MKIVQVLPLFGLGGAEIMCENLTYELIRLGHEVTVISLYDDRSAITERLEKAGVDCRYLGKKPGLDLSLIHKISSILKEKHADVVHTHLYSTTYAIPAAILAGVKHRVHTLHNIATKENGKLARRLNKFFFQHCHVVPVALSELVRDTIVEEYGFTKEQIPVILNGIDLSQCCVKQSYEVDGAFKIVHVGSFKEAKNHVGLLEAFEKLHLKHQDTQLHLIGYGAGQLQIEQLVKEKNLQEFVVFHGAQSNVHQFLHTMDIFTLPSLYEGIPMTIIEAMGTALPIVATTVGGIPDMLDENSALLVSVDTEAVAQAFERYYHDQKLREKHGANALMKAERFSAKTMAEEYVKVYSK